MNLLEPRQRGGNNCKCRIYLLIYPSFAKPRSWRPPNTVKTHQYCFFFFGFLFGSIFRGSSILLFFPGFDFLLFFLAEFCYILELGLRLGGAPPHHQCHCTRSAALCRTLPHSAASPRSAVIGQLLLLPNLLLTFDRGRYLPCLLLCNSSSHALPRSAAL